ncbi:MAG: preprotein translocase subunit Sec61beta [Candidatus Aenigmarchaeota archaeon]|nr:preprotein translocase subunit Sec61beta [Candidatus Aenigmarchaeota archaeon]MCK5474723.1 preprotein translocase subunit Sec61beta [Candidatus Aenigmarchaeota archaeon]
MAKEKTSMPQSTAGLVRYFDEYKEAIQIPPQAIVGLCVGIIVISVFMRIFFI